MPNMGLEVTTLRKNSNALQTELARHSLAFNYVQIYSVPKSKLFSVIFSFSFITIPTTLFPPSPYR